MKITIEKLDAQGEGVVEVFQDVSHYYLAVRQLCHLEAGDGLAGEWRTRSYSCKPTGGNLRDVTKEIRQSLMELDLQMSKET